MTEKIINYWLCLNCGKELNSNNVLMVKDKDNRLNKIFSCKVMKCPYCNVVDNPHNLKEYKFKFLRNEVLNTK